MDTIPDGYSLLYHRLRLSRNVIPLLMSVGVLAFEIFEHGTTLSGWTPAVDVLVFGVIGPGATFLVLNWLLHRVKERDEAEARLAVLRAHERELLAQLERSVRAERFGLVPTLQSILVALSAEYSITGGALYLLSRTKRKLLPATACWPSSETGVLLAEAAERALANDTATRLDHDGTIQIAGLPSAQRIITVPIADRGETLGFLVLTGTTQDAPPDDRVLGVAAGAIALLVRNNQLYAQLQSQAVIEERTELAREVHDGLAQSLAFLNFKAQHVRRLLDRGDVSAATLAADELVEGNRETYEEVRVLIRNLRSSVGVAGVLVPSIRSYSAMLAKRTGMEITVEAGEDPSLSPGVQLQLFRVVQEALTNAHKHAKAHYVRVRLDERLGCVNLIVEDDGAGLSTSSIEADGIEQENDSLDASVTPEHFGLHIMQERMQSIGGELQIESRPGKGTTVCLRVPAGCLDGSSEEVLQDASQSPAR